MKKDRIYLNQLSKTPKDLSYDTETEWMEQILKELQEDVDEKDIPVAKSKPGKVEFKGTIERNQNAKYGDYALLKGSVSANFYTYCIKSGEVMLDYLAAEVKATFIDEKYKELYQLEEEITLFIEDDEYELYYLKNNQCPVEVVINESVFLNKNLYPKKTIQAF